VERGEAGGRGKGREGERRGRERKGRGGRRERETCPIRFSTPFTPLATVTVICISRSLPAVLNNFWKIFVTCRTSVLSLYILRREYTLKLHFSVHGLVNWVEARRFLQQH
jgi:hypothetical protein